MAQHHHNYYDKRIAPPLSKSLGHYTHSHHNVKTSPYSCVSIGECDVCSPLEKKTMSYCQAYGNKEPVHCEWTDAGLDGQKNQTTVYDNDAISLPMFQACPRVKRVEQWHLIQFESLNCGVAVLSLLVVVWRQRTLSQEQHLHLARRIGSMECSAVQ
ncbi:hypothetical protein BDF14DRAFT_1992710 [Spinellus fusiger]|nr:hypothetical protein BDF14DRAFT_1992710 [Spinellus fusiger]